MEFEIRNMYHLFYHKNVCKARENIHSIINLSKYVTELFLEMHKTDEK